MEQFEFNHDKVRHSIALHLDRLTKKTKQALLEFFSLKEIALKELRARWGKPLKQFRSRQDIARLHALTCNDTTISAVDDCTWHDLDMDDLYERLDSCITPIGRQYLFRQLKNYETNEQSLRHQYSTTKYFQENTQLREQTQLHLMGLRSSNHSLITDMLFGKPPDGQFPHLAAWLLAGTSILSIAVAFLNPALFWLPIFSFLVNFFFTLKYEDQIGRHSVSYGSLKKLLKVARGMHVLRPDFEITQLDYLYIHRNFIKRRYKNFRLFGIDSTSSNAIQAQFAFFFNLICLFDFLMFIKLTKHLKSHKQQLIEIYTAIASLDSAIAVASYLSASKSICNPAFCADNKMRFENVTHPLIMDAIPNSFTSESHSALVTGSNMAGKSTFIKTIGLNLILAQTLWVCHAQAAFVPKMPVQSSIKKTDSINEGKSYYFVEIEALLRLIKSAKHDRPHVFLIDEILHGTNTIERVASSAAILDLLGDNNTVLVTSHDVELTNLLSKKFLSYHFQETGNLDNMFDYKLRDGHSKTRNAISLLDRIGFPDDMIEQARKNVTMLDHN